MSSTTETTTATTGSTSTRSTSTGSTSASTTKDTTSSQDADGEEEDEQEHNKQKKQQAKDDVKDDKSDTEHTSNRVYHTNSDHTESIQDGPRPIRRDFKLDLVGELQTKLNELRVDSDTVVQKLTASLATCRDLRNENERLRRELSLNNKMKSQSQDAFMSQSMEMTRLRNDYREITMKFEETQAELTDYKSRLSSTERQLEDAQEMTNRMEELVYTAVKQTASYSKGPNQILSQVAKIKRERKTSAPTTVQDIQRLLTQTKRMLTRTSTTQTALQVTNPNDGKGVQNRKKSGKSIRSSPTKGTSPMSPQASPARIDYRSKSSLPLSREASPLRIKHGYRSPQWSMTNQKPIQTSSKTIHLKNVSHPLVAGGSPHTVVVAATHSPPKPTSMQNLTSHRHNSPHRREPRRHSSGIGRNSWTILGTRHLRHNSNHHNRQRHHRKASKPDRLNHRHNISMVAFNTNNNASSSPQRHGSSETERLQHLLYKNEAQYRDTIQAFNDALMEKEAALAFAAEKGQTNSILENQLYHQRKEYQAIIKLKNEELRMKERLLAAYNKERNQLTTAFEKATKTMLTKLTQKNELIQRMSIDYQSESSQLRSRVQSLEVQAENYKDSLQRLQVYSDDELNVLNQEIINLHDKLHSKEAELHNHRKITADVVAMVEKLNLDLHIKDEVIKQLKNDLANYQVGIQDTEGDRVLVKQRQLDKRVVSLGFPRIVDGCLVIWYKTRSHGNNFLLLKIFGGKLFVVERTGILAELNRILPNLLNSPSLGHAALKLDKGTQFPRGHNRANLPSAMQMQIHLVGKRAHLAVDGRHLCSHKPIMFVDDEIEESLNREITPRPYTCTCTLGLVDEPIPEPKMLEESRERANPCYTNSILTDTVYDADGMNKTHDTTNEPNDKKHRRNTPYPKDVPKPSSSSTTDSSEGSSDSVSGSESDSTSDSETSGSGTSSSDSDSDSSAEGKNDILSTARDNRSQNANASASIITGMSDYGEDNSADITQIILTSMKEDRESFLKDPKGYKPSKDKYTVKCGEPSAKSIDIESMDHSSLMSETANRGVQRTWVLGTTPHTAELKEYHISEPASPMMYTMEWLNRQPDVKNHKQLRKEPKRRLQTLEKEIERLQRTPIIDHQHRSNPIKSKSPQRSPTKSDATSQLLDDYDWSLPELELPDEFYQSCRRAKQHGTIQTTDREMAECTKATAVGKDQHHNVVNETDLERMARRANQVGADYKFVRLSGDNELKDYKKQHTIDLAEFMAPIPEIIFNQESRQYELRTSVPNRQPTKRNKNGNRPSEQNLS